MSIRILNFVDRRYYNTDININYIMQRPNHRLAIHIVVSSNIVDN